MKTETKDTHPLEQENATLRQRVKDLRKVLELAPPRGAISDTRYWAWLQLRDQALK